MTDMLQEFCDSRGMALRVDRSGGVIRGIKILGLHSRNSREYLPEALSRAVGLYEGAKVNVNHPKGHPLAPRDYQERIGVIRNVQHRAGEGLFADFHFNPKHYLSEQLAWDAEHAPENVGFSHNVQARTSRRGESTIVEEILRVHSVDLVADPATTRGLFESASTAADTEASDNQQSNQLEKLCREQADEIARLQTEIDRLQAQAAVEQRRALIRSLLVEYRLPDPATADPVARGVVSEAFIQSLVAAPNEPAMRQLLEERARLIGSVMQQGSRLRTATGRPVSRDQTLIDPAGNFNGQSFARAVTA